MSHCINCGRGVHRALRDNVPGERCARCRAAHPSPAQARIVYPHMVDVVALHVGNRAFAERVVARASGGDQLYTAIVREAWRRRKVKRWLKTT